MTRLRLGLGQLRETNSTTIFKAVLILFVVMVWISNQLFSFLSTIPYLMIKESFA